MPEFSPSGGPSDQPHVPDGTRRNVIPSSMAHGDYVSVADRQRAAKVHCEGRTFWQAGVSIAGDGCGNCTRGTTGCSADNGALHAATAADDVADNGTGSGTNGDFLRITTFPFCEHCVGGDVTRHRIRLTTEGDAADIECQFRFIALMGRPLRLRDDE